MVIKMDIVTKIVIIMVIITGLRIMVMATLMGIIIDLRKK